MSDNSAATSTVSTSSLVKTSYLESLPALAWFDLVALCAIVFYTPLKPYAGYLLLAWLALSVTAAAAMLWFSKSALETHRALLPDLESMAAEGDTALRVRLHFVSTSESFKDTLLKSLLQPLTLWWKLSTSGANLTYSIPDLGSVHVYPRFYWDKKELKSNLRLAVLRAVYHAIHGAQPDDGILTKVKEQLPQLTETEASLVAVSANLTLYAIWAHTKSTQNMLIDAKNLTSYDEVMSLAVDASATRWLKGLLLKAEKSSSLKDVTSFEDVKQRVFG